MKALALVLVLASACEQPRTQMMIGVATDMKAPNVIDGAELVVTRTSDGFVEQQVSWQISGAPNQPFNLPGSYGVYSDGAEVQLDIVLTGLKGANPVVSRRAVLNLIEDKTLFFRMGITAGCAAAADCPSTQSCVEGVCRDVAVDARQLPDFAPELITELTCNSGVAYVDTATGAPLPLSSDADQCPVGLCSEGTCLKPMPTDTKPPDSRSDGGIGPTGADSGTTPTGPDGGTGGTTGRVMPVACPGAPAAFVSTSEGVNAYQPTAVFVSKGQVVKFSMSISHDVEPLPPNTDGNLRVGPGQTQCLQFLDTGTFDFTCVHGHTGTVTVN